MSLLWVWALAVLCYLITLSDAIIVGTNGNLYILNRYYIPIDPQHVYRNQEEFARIHGPRGSRLIAALATNDYRLPMAGYSRAVSWIPS
ncbi:hypothetical protein FHG87_018086 [Trinorchestia longiramus]|nr:hypothetical protein FHG87_018086 [Trinorchestia longiramus]